MEGNRSSGKGRNRDELKSSEPMKRGKWRRGEKVMSFLGITEKDACRKVLARKNRECILSTGRDLPGS